MLDDLFDFDDVRMAERGDDLELLVGELFEVFGVLHLLDGDYLVGEPVPGLVDIGEVPTAGLR